MQATLFREKEKKTQVAHGVVSYGLSVGKDALGFPCKLYTSSLQYADSLVEKYLPETDTKLAEKDKLLSKNVAGISRKITRRSARKVVAVVRRVATAVKNSPAAFKKTISDLRNLKVKIKLMTVEDMKKSLAPLIKSADQMLLKFRPTAAIRNFSVNFYIKMLDPYVDPLLIKLGLATPQQKSLLESTIGIKSIMPSATRSAPPAKTNAARASEAPTQPPAAPAPPPRPLNTGQAGMTDEEAKQPVHAILHEVKSAVSERIGLGKRLEAVTPAAQQSLPADGHAAAPAPQLFRSEVTPPAKRNAARASDAPSQPPAAPTAPSLSLPSSLPSSLPPSPATPRLPLQKEYPAPTPAPAPVKSEHQSASTTLAPLAPQALSKQAVTKNPDDKLLTDTNALANALADGRALSKLGEAYVDRPQTPPPQRVDKAAVTTLPKAYAPIDFTSGDM